MRSFTTVAFPGYLHVTPLAKVYHDPAKPLRRIVFIIVCNYFCHCVVAVICVISLLPVFLPFPLSPPFPLFPKHSPFSHHTQNPPHLHTIPKTLPICTPYPKPSPFSHHTQNPPHFHTHIPYPSSVWAPSSLVCWTPFLDPRSSEFSSLDLIMLVRRPFYVLFLCYLHR